MKDIGNLNNCSEEVDLERAEKVLSSEEICIACRGTGIFKRMKPRKAVVCAVCEGEGKNVKTVIS